VSRSGGPRTLRNAARSGSPGALLPDFGQGLAGRGAFPVDVGRVQLFAQIEDAEIEEQIADFGRRANSLELTLEEMEGGTFTISNGGVFGSLLSTPILNPPQSGVLGLHKIQDRPVAENGQVVIRPMMYIALSYDHRIIDGKEAVSFLRSVKDALEDPARLLLEL